MRTCGERSGREKVDLPCPVFQHHLELASLSRSGLDLDVDAGTSAARVLHLGISADRLANSFQDLGPVAGGFLFALATALEAVLRPRGKAPPDLVLVTAIDGLRELLKRCPRRRLALGPDDRRQRRMSRAPGDQRRLTTAPTRKEDRSLNTVASCERD